MPNQAFLELHDGSDADLERMIALAGRLARWGPVLLGCSDASRLRVRRLLERVVGGAERSRIALLETGGYLANGPAVRAAGLCVFSDAALATHLRDDQVAIYAHEWRAAL